MNDETGRFEQKIKDTEISFSHRLDEQEKKYNEISAELATSKRNNELLDLELKQLKNQEPEKLSHNLLFSGSMIPVPTLSENLPRLVVDLVKNHTRYHLSEADILSAERFGKKPAAGSPDNRGILVKFHSKDQR